MCYPPIKRVLICSLDHLIDKMIQDPSKQKMAGYSETITIHSPESSMGTYDPRMGAEMTSDLTDFEADQDNVN